MSAVNSIRRSLLLGAGGALSVHALGVHAEAFPTKVIRIVVPYAAGGSTDQLARVINRPMGDRLGQTVIVDNRAGAGGTIGVDDVVRSAPDGYSLVFGNTGPNAIVSLMRKVPYDQFKDLQPISTVAFTPMILAVPASSPARTLKEFLDYAKAQGDKLNFGSVGPGSLSHLTGEFFNEKAGLRLQHIAYNGGSPLMTAFVSGEIQAAFVTGLDGATLYKAGKVRYLGVATEGPTEAVPGVQPIAELVPGFKSSAWFGVLAPAGTPPDVVAKLNAAIVASVNLPATRAFFTERNIEAHSSTPGELAQIIRDEVAQWGPVIRKNHIVL